MMNDVIDQLAVFTEEVGMEGKLDVQTVVASVEGIREEITYLHSCLYSF